ncbi:hypothetical protein C3387_12400 [Leclercia sp. LSNIH6]|nr:hypothetical protein C3370_07400 [Leclercia sp. LSNIH7]POU77805.1 hypothetical protein C3387_12400 [Leclercia sp. LSNIH6]POW50383.1 hypothetical protein C3406_15805 [Leclercia sp. LSNIH8]
MFNGPAFSAKMSELLYNGNFAQFETEMDNAVYPSEESTRINRMLNLYSEIKDCLSKEYPGTIKITLEDFNDKPISLDNISITELINKEDGLYSEPGTYIMASSFENDMKDVPEATKQQLINCYFQSDIPQSWTYKYRVMSDVTFCTEERNIHACISKGRYYDRLISSRISRSCAVNFVRETKEIIEQAIVLTIPYQSRNYYHSMAEMAYALRICKGSNLPIIYSEDNFKIIPFISKLLGIESSRFINFNSAKNVMVKKAIMPHPPSFTWDPKLFEFFYNLIQKERGKIQPFAKIYISRSFSSRGPTNETSLEKELIRNGFIIIHPEFMPLEEQALIFNLAKIIISPHGAGLTNIIFCAPNTPFIELQNSSYVNRDFYLRSRHNKMPYYPIVFESDIDIKEVVEATKKMLGN